MFDIFNQAMLFCLDFIYAMVHNYGLAIVILTVVMRLILWPLNSSQTRSMKKMQELQPKLKEIQEKYKGNPQKMQEAMLKFYGEHKFNPMAGCLPMLVQLPIFIGLFGALQSPAFLAESVNENFLFIDQLSHTLHTHAGQPLSGEFSVKEGDKFITDRTITLVPFDSEPYQKVVGDPAGVIRVKPSPVLPGQPMNVTLNFEAMGYGPEYGQLLESVKLLMINEQTKEIERVTLKNRDGVLTTEVPTVPGTTQWNEDVLILIAVYGLLMLLYQKVMTPARPPAAATAGGAPDMQQRLMKMMPMMFVVMMFFIPIPAGVMLYLVVTTALMFVQTAWVNFTESKNSPKSRTKPGDQVVEVKPD